MKLLIHSQTSTVQSMLGLKLKHASIRVPTPPWLHCWIIDISDAVMSKRYSNIYMVVGKQRHFQIAVYRQRRVTSRKFTNGNISIICFTELILCYLQCVLSKIQIGNIQLVCCRISDRPVIWEAMMLIKTSLMFYIENNKYTYLRQNFQLV